MHGELKVRPETDTPTRFSTFETLFVGKDPGKVRPYTVRGVRFQPLKKGTTVLLSLEEIGSREEAASLLNAQLFATAAALDLGVDEYFIHDLIGFDVVTDERVFVGLVKDILDMPAHAVYLVAAEGKPDIMIPDVDAFIEEINLDARQIVVRPIEGLLDG